MTQTEFRMVLREALLGAAAALEDDLAAGESCDHPRDTLEKLPMPMGAASARVRCGRCGEELLVSWEELDGEN